jgi:PUA domain protein
MHCYRYIAISPFRGEAAAVRLRRLQAIFAEGKEHALAVGIMKMSSDDIKSLNKGIGIEIIHFLNDGLWCMDYSP